MSNVKIIGPAVPNMPWQERPEGLKDAPVWRYNENPVIGRNPVKGVARIFNSAVMPYGDEFIGVFRGEQTNGVPYIYIWDTAKMRFTGILMRIRLNLWTKRGGHLCQYMHMIHVL